MKRIRKALMMILVLVLCVCPLMNVEAAGKNVTASMKKNKYVKKISKDMASYTSSKLISGYPKKTKKEKLKGYNALSIAGYVGYQHGKSFFSKKEIQKRTYNLFGIKPKTSTVPTMYSSKAKHLVKRDSDYSSKPYEYFGGDWSSMVPKYSIKKVVKVKKNVYDVTIHNKVGYISDITGKIESVEKIGTTVIRIKKNPKSSYKYKVTRMRYKTN